MDETFLKEKAYPFMYDVVTFLENIIKINNDGVRRLPLSSCPEVFDNSINAWFKTTTNYDLALMKFAFRAAEMAETLNKELEAEHWRLLLNQLLDFDLDNDNSLTLDKGFPYKESH